MSVPAERTWMFCRIVSVTTPSFWPSPGGLPEASTSTRIPGHGARPHALRNRWRQSAAGAKTCQLAVENRLALRDIGDHAATDRVFLFHNRALGWRARQ